MSEDLSEKAATLAFDVLKQKMVGYVQKRVMSKLLSIAFFAWGPMPVITGYFLEKLLYSIAVELVVIAKYFKIDMEEEQEAKDVQDALDAYLGTDKGTVEEGKKLNEVIESIDDLISIG